MIGTIFNSTLFKLFLVTGMAGLSLVASGCIEDPLRSHPLDPLGENFINEGSLSIKATNFYPPRNGLQAIQVRIDPGVIVGQTNNSGDFFSNGLASGNYTVTVEGDGYLPVDTLITISAGETTSLVIPLQGLPTFSSFELTSLHVSRWFPPPEELFSLEITAELDDKDGIADIDSLWIVIDDFDYREPVVVETTPGTYIHSIPATTLPIPMTALPGHNIYLRAIDRAGTVNTSLARLLIRVIDETPLALDPKDLEFAPDPTPLFTWEPVSLTFPYTFRIDVVRIDQNVRTTILTLEDIPSSETSIESPDAILAGEYFWTVSVVDEFGNRSRSREAGFRIR